MLDQIPCSPLHSSSGIRKNEDSVTDSPKVDPIHSLWVLKESTQTPSTASSLSSRHIQPQTQSSTATNLSNLIVEPSPKHERRRSFLKEMNEALLPLSIPENADHTKKQEAREDAQIFWLNQKGYTSLAEKLILHGTEEPWSSIKTIKSPILMEQLMQLYSLCQLTPLTDEQKKTILDFALIISKSAVSNTSRKAFSIHLFHKTKILIGELIYLVDKSPLIALACIQGKTNKKEIIQELEAKFNEQLDLLHQELVKTFKAHQETQIQSPEVVLSTLIPKQIAKILLLRTGQINYGIIHKLLTIFLSSSTLQSYEVNLSYALKLIQKSPQLRCQFEKILSPHDATAPANEVIRASINLNSRNPITELHAKETILSALLSHLRQDNEGTCFATSSAIEILSSHLEHCFKDLTFLIRESKLTRTIKNTSKDIPFIRKIFDENLDKVFYIHNDGSMIIENDKKGKIWQAPAIQAICNYLEIENPQTACQAALRMFLTQNKSSIKKIKTKDFIEQLCRFKIGFSRTNESLVTDMVERACLIFSSQTTHPLLKIWENAIANMAETQERGMIKATTVESILYAFQLKMTELNLTPAPYIKNSLTEIQNLLFAKLSYRYDPKIEKTKDLLLPVKENGFVLYYNDERIDTPKKFSKFVNAIMDRAYKNVSRNDTSNSQNEIRSLFGILKSYANSNNFLITSVAKYHPSNRIYSDLINRLPLLNFTPWICKMGHNSKSLLETYLESEHPFKSEKLLRENCEERLGAIIKMGQKMSDKEKLSYLNNPHKLTQFRIPGQHSSSLMLGHASLSAAWLQDRPAEEWIRECVIAPGIAIAEKPIDLVTKHNLLRRLNLGIAPQFIEKSRLSNFQKLINEIPDGISIKNYRNALLKSFKQVGVTCEPLCEKIARHIDTALCKSLEPILKAKLEGLAIQFADTNWSSNASDLHFSFIVNPGTGKLEMWQSFADGTQLQALDQNYWLINKEWEFFHLPESLLPDDIL